MSTHSLPRLSFVHSGSLQHVVRSFWCWNITFRSSLTARNLGEQWTERQRWWTSDKQINKKRLPLVKSTERMKNDCRETSRPHVQTRRRIWALTTVCECVHASIFYNYLVFRYLSVLRKRPSACLRSLSNTSINSLIIPQWKIPQKKFKFCHISCH